MEVTDVHAVNSVLGAGQILGSPWLCALWSWKDSWQLPRNATAIHHS